MDPLKILAAAALGITAPAGLWAVAGVTFEGPAGAPPEVAGDQRDAAPSAVLVGRAPPTIAVAPPVVVPPALQGTEESAPSAKVPVPTVSGVVVDEDGRPVPSASVQCTSGFG